MLVMERVKGNELKFIKSLQVYRVEVVLGWCFELEFYIRYV